MVRVSQLSGLDSSAELVNLIDSIPLISRAQAQSAVDKLERAVADAAEARVQARVVPKVESAVKKGIVLSIGGSILATVLLVRLAR